MERRVEPREATSKSRARAGADGARRSRRCGPRRSRSVLAEVQALVGERLPVFPSRRSVTSTAPSSGTRVARISVSAPQSLRLSAVPSSPLRCAGSATSCGSIDSRGETTCCSRRRSPVRAIAIASRVTDAVGSGQPAATCACSVTGTACGARLSVSTVPSASRAATRQRSHASRCDSARRSSAPASARVTQPARRLADRHATAGGGEGTGAAGMAAAVLPACVARSSTVTRVRGDRVDDAAS